MRGGDVFIAPGKLWDGCEDVATPFRSPQPQGNAWRVGWCGVSLRGHEFRAD